MRPVSYLYSIPRWLLGRESNPDLLNQSQPCYRYTTENVFASGDSNRHGCCTHLLATRPPKGKWRSGFSDARIGCCRRWRLGQGHKAPACPWLPRDAVWHSRLTTRTARCRLGPTPLGANIRYLRCASRLGHCAVSRADSAASRVCSARRRTELAPWYGRREEDSRVREEKRGWRLLV